MEKKLYRNPEGKKISGVCMGISDYTGIDVTVIRIFWVIMMFFTAFVGSIIFYIACVFIIPELPPYIEVEYTEKDI